MTRRSVPPREALLHGIQRNVERERTIRLLQFQGLRGSGGDYSYEVLNLVNGRRTAQEIRRRPILVAGNAGGKGSGTDVDAYTFNYQGYHERHTRLGPWRWRQKGVWTKILTNEFADCSIGANNEIWCTMLVQK